MESDAWKAGRRREGLTKQRASMRWRNDHQSRRGRLVRTLGGTTARIQIELGATYLIGYRLWKCGISAAAVTMRPPSTCPSAGERACQPKPNTACVHALVPRDAFTSARSFTYHYYCLGIQFLSSGQDDIDGMSQHSRCVLDLSQHHLVPARTLLAYVSATW